jgi:two-component system, cell cycle response regulator
MQKEILFVDDCQEHIKVLEESLKGDFYVFVARNTVEAINLLNSHKNEFQLILISFASNLIHGVDLLSLIRNNSLHSTVPIVAVVDSNYKDVDTLIKYSVDEMMRLPFGGRFVRNRIYNILEAKKYRELMQNSNNLFSNKKSKIDSGELLFPLKTMPKKQFESINMHSFFDFYRLIDKSTNLINYFDENGELCESTHHCYETWNRNCPCIACISDQCLFNKKEYFKIDRFQEKTFMISSIPFEINNKTYALELIKDVSYQLILSDTSNNTNFSVNEYLNQFNNLSNRDVFTGLYNKIFLFNKIQKKLDKKTPFQVAMIDLNDFKKVNDYYGHVSGDQMILFLTSLLFQLEKETGCIAGRLSGDEFLIIADNDFQLRKEIIKLNSAFEANVFNNGKSTFKTNFAFGIVESKNYESVTKLYEDVDRKMYICKREQKHIIK